MLRDHHSGATGLATIALLNAALLTAAWITAALVTVPLRVPTVAAQTSYGLDEDPIRLGNKALEQGRLEDARGRFDAAVAAAYQVDKAKFGLAVVAERQGRYADAESLYREAISVRRERGHDYPEARAGLGLVLLRGGQVEAAADEFQRALQEDSGLWEAQYGQARALIAQERWDDAKKLLDRGAKRRGLAAGEDKFHYGMALYRLGKGEDIEAEKEALLALHLNPGDPEHGLLVSRIYSARGTTALAIGALEQALAAPGMIPTAPLLHTLGQLYQKDQRFNEARDRYLEAMAADSTYAPALKDLGELLRMAKQYDRAARVLLRYRTLNPGDVDALVGLAESCLEIAQSDTALEAARAAMALDPARTDARRAFVRAGLRSADKQAQAAAADTFARMTDDPDWTAADWLALGEQRASAKRFDEARASLERALALAPEQPQVHFQLGVVELSAGHAAAAATHFERAIALKPDTPAYHLNLGIAYSQERRHADATAALRRALGLNDQLTVGHLLLAQTLAAADSLSAAAAEYELVLAVEPGNGRALRGLGFCHLRRGRYGEAARVYRRATEAEPENADGWAGLGNAQLGAGDLSAAEEALRRARSLDPANPAMKKGFEILEQARKAADQSG